MDREEVIKKVKHAFSGVELGEGVGLLEAQAMDNYESEKVQKEERKNDEKEYWQSLDYESLQNYHSSLSFFDADGMRFHLSAYIIGSMEGNVDDPIFHLTDLDDYARSRLKTLTKFQRSAVVSYLYWCLEQEDYEFNHPSIVRALDEYWEK